ncbi:MAG TPA: radical SAM protein [Spirochaetota bacterium]|nr:radical SAM protein [Spirochaetota bacterium]HPI88241.1 radical SAM protein [Spirochaetota bacterium]HPR47215.1 radical SAM protein [Spirochaetota bacterium]
MKYIFGPVNSRRLGLSLGIDLVSFKTCSLNCIYCECGKTTALTSSREEYVPTSDVLSEIEQVLSPGPELDVVTFSGSGEPTLHRDIGVIINYIKDTFPRYRVAVLTNGTMLWKQEVRQALVRADVVVPSLDAVSEEVFTRMLRPAPGISAEKTVAGLIEFSRHYRGSLIIEVFIVPGINDSEEELGKIKDACMQVNPSLVQLNKLDRPGAEDWITRAANGRLSEIRDYFKPLPVEIIGEPGASPEVKGDYFDVVQRVLSTLKRRPSTVDDLEKTLGLRRVEVVKIIDELTRKGLISSETMERGVFYRVVEQ